jgi:hypothetical protein
MERYRKLKVIGKGSFGYAVMVQSVADRLTYVMKVNPQNQSIENNKFFSLSTLTL